MTGAGIAMRAADLPVGRSLFPVQGVFPGQSAPHLSRTARLRRNCASFAAFRSRAAESVSCTVCRMCGGVCEYVRHAAEFMRFRCPACARRRELPARGACRAGDGVFSEFTNRITLLKQRKSKSKRKKHILSEHCCRVPFVPASNDGVEASSPFPDLPPRRIPSA